MVIDISSKTGERTPRTDDEIVARLLEPKRFSRAGATLQLASVEQFSDENQLTIDVILALAKITIQFYNQLTDPSHRQAIRDDVRQTLTLSVVLRDKLGPDVRDAREKLDEQERETKK